MIYADYDYYTNAYLGNAISEEDFPRLSLRASQYIDYITQDRAKDNGDLEAVKMCCCALAEQYQIIESAKSAARKGIAAASADGAEVQSETVGSWSRSYRSGGESAQAAAQSAEAGKAALYGIAGQYLTSTSLLYRGGRCCR